MNAAKPVAGKQGAPVIDRHAECSEQASIRSRALDAGFNPCAERAGRQRLVLFKSSLVHGHAPALAAGVFARRTDAAEMRSVGRTDEAGLGQAALPMQGGLH
jgi:hypothetical protein